MSEGVVRVLIVDDEPLARVVIRKMLAFHPEVEISAECSNAPEAIRALRNEAVDLVFLDVQMPEKDGFTVIEQLGERMPYVVFVTAFDQYAVRAFEVHALDYLLKPFDRDRFEKTMRRAREEIARDHGSGLNQRLMALMNARSSNENPAQLAIKCDGRVIFVRCKEVKWLEAQGNFVEVQAGSAKYLVRESLTAFEEQLDRRRFRRIQRSVIVNIDHIRELRPLFRGDYIVLLHDGTELKLSHRYRSNMDGCLGGKL